ncbi:MAG TPA: sigma 54-interacting transcriptional regulator, partial [Polyangiaceae bacterium]|nr:sigma 54-interacting transcriptional regulator [Polyangiaceae bacterium]
MVGLRPAEPAALLYGDLLGVSPVMRDLFTKLSRLEGSKVNLLVSGESGTGKELIARALHEHSAVGGGPFVAVNCGGLDHHLARSDLFGHERGAFT